MSSRFCVIGSINMDLVVQVDRFPVPGETLTGSVFNTFPGGKGANQAVALAKLGADVRMAGKVGNDGFGSQYRAHFTSEGVDFSAVETVPDCSTGVAVIEVDGGGENHIVIVPGANGQVDREYVRSILDDAGDMDIFLLQLEIPLESVEFALGELKQRNKRVILDPAPMPDASAFRNILASADIITPNETEIQLLTGIEITGLEAAKRAGDELLGLGTHTVIIKAGGNGSYIVTADGARHVPAFAVEVVDTTGAGDSFNAGIAFALGQGKSIYEAVRFASAVGGLACSAFGAQSSMPDLAAVERLIG